MSSPFNLVESSSQHLREAREGYFQHLAFAALVSALLLSAALACLLHALVPGLCRTSASRIVTLLTQLFADRSQLRSTTRAGSGPLVLTALVGLSVPPLLLLLSAGGHALLLPLGLLCLAVPLAYVWSNPDLDPVV
jgi:hypothetical protein